MSETTNSQPSPFDQSTESSEVDQAGAQSDPATGQPGTTNRFADSPDEGVAASTTKPADQWVTGDEPATGAQLSYLSTLAREAGEPVPENLTKAHASELIDQYRQESPRVEG